MKNIFCHDGVKLSVRLDETNTKDTIFGELEFTVNGHVLSNREEHNLSYFCVDCEAWRLFLEKNPVIENELFAYENPQIIELWQVWNRCSRSNFEEPADLLQKADFFSDRYFKTGTVLRSTFFNHIFAFFVADADSVRIKYWETDNPVITELLIKKSVFLSCLGSFEDFFYAVYDSFD